MSAGEENSEYTNGEVRGARRFHEPGKDVDFSMLFPSPPLEIFYFFKISRSPGSPARDSRTDGVGRD